MLVRFMPWKLTGLLCHKSVEWKKLLLRAGAAAAAGLLLFSCFSLHAPSYSEYLLRSLKGAIPYDDPELIQYIRNEILVPPSTLAYHLQGRFNPALIAVDDSEYFYANMTEKLFKNMRDGVFIEAGALDGETMSNTLKLEKFSGWTGLLVEADPVSYSKMTQKHRKAWMANCCISPYSYPSKELMSSTSHYVGPNIIKAGTKMRAMHSLASYRRGSGLTNSWFKRIQCLPLESMLVALNYSHIDLFVLDVEGAEMDILSHLDFKKFEVDVIYLEWKKIYEHVEIAKKVEERGYRLYNKEAEDLIFVRKDSKYDPGHSYVIPPRNRTLSDEQKKAFAELMKKGIYIEGNS